MGSGKVRKHACLLCARPRPVYLGPKNPCSRSTVHALWESCKEGRGYTEKQLRSKGSTVSLSLCVLLLLLSVAKLCLTLLRPHGLQATSLLCLWDSPGKNIGVGCISFSRESS